MPVTDPALQQRLEALAPKVWTTDLTAAYLAVVYKILKQDELADNLAGGVGVFLEQTGLRRGRAGAGTLEVTA